VAVPRLRDPVSPASRPPGADPALSARRLPLLVLGLLAVSLVPRLVHLGAPPLDRHDFRQTQTGITVWAFLDGGPSLLHPQTPVLGPPWEVPFELPVFQLSAWAVARTTGLDLDLACRLTGVLWFYLSAWTLFLLVRRWGESRLAIASAGIYLFTPFALQWSRAVLIDYAAVALALGSLHLGLTWTETSRIRPALGSVVLGAAAAATKVTTLVGVAAAAIALCPPSFLVALLRGSLPTRARAVGGLLVLAGVPLAAGIAWTRWADAIKAAHPATAWLTSAHLTEWNFGTAAQRLSWEPWARILGRIGYALLPGTLALSVPLAILLAARGPQPLRPLVRAALAGALAPVLVLFNLYAVHDYYLIAISPFLAIVAASGVLQLVAMLPAARRGRWLALAATVTLLTSLPSWRYPWPTYAVDSGAPIARLGRLIDRSTEPRQWVAVQGDQWNSRILYTARRRGFMIWEGLTDVTPLAGRPEFGALVCRECSPGLLALFPRRRQVGQEAGWEVYRLWGPGEAEPGAQSR